MKIHLFSLTAGILFSQMILCAPPAETKTIPGDYATLAEAVTALNSGTVPDGGITFNIASGHTESLTAPIILTATGREGSPVTFIKSGTGTNPLIIRTDAGTVSVTTPGNHGDGVLILQGSDYIIIDGINISASDQGIEYGYYLRKASSEDPCRNVTIRNATVTLTKGTSRASAGICIANNSATSSNINITAATGAHENITITANTISNSFIGIILKGHSAWPDRNITVGAEGLGNTINNFGGAVSYESSGIRAENIDNSNIGHNNINNTAGGGTPFTGAIGNGILNAGNGFNSINISNNTFTLTTEATVFGQHLYGIRNRDKGNILINNNTITLQCGVATGINLYYISNDPTAAGSGNVTINNNCFGSVSNPHSGTIYFINNPYTNAAPSVTEVSGNYNAGTITKTEPGGGIYLYFNNMSPTGTEIISSNSFSDIHQSGSSTFYGILSNTIAGHTQNVFNNTISNITSGTGTFNAIQLLSSGTRRIYNNTISNINTSGTIAAITSGSGDSYTDIYLNDINGLTSTSTATSGVIVSGIAVSAGLQIFIYNNYISGLYSPQGASIDALRGISITNTQDNSLAGLYYNTIFLDNTTSGTHFGSAAVYHTARTQEGNCLLDLRNNILINISVPQGVGRTAALRRSSVYLNNYSTTSDNNIFYAGTPGMYNVLYFDGNGYQTPEAFQAAVTPREASSHAELSPFVNTSTQPYNLHIRTDVPTLAESTGNTVTSPLAITTDFDADTRAGNPDIGADEFNGISAYVANPSSVTAPTYSSQQIRLAFTPNGSGNDVVIVYNTTGTFTDPSGIPVVDQPLAGGTVVYNNSSSPFIHGSLTTGTTYHYKVFSYNGSSYSKGVKVSSSPAVEPVTTLRAVAAGQTANTINWTRNNAGHEVIIANYSSYINGNPVNGTQYNTGDSIPNGGTVIYRGPATEYNHTGLGAWTQYYYKAWSVDAFNYHSTPLAVNCITDTPPMGIPYQQDFNSTWSHEPAAPEGWYVEDYLATAFTWSRNILQVHSEPASARGYGSGTCDDYLISPPVILPDSDIQLSWWDINNDATNLTSYKVLLSTGGRDTASFDKVLGDYTCINTEWQLRTIDLSPYKGQTVYLAFHLYNTTNQYRYFSIDDILVEETIPGPCQPGFPTNGLLTFAGKINLTWLPPVSSIPITGYKVYLGTTSNPTGMVYSGTETSFETAPLSYGTTYYWKVVATNANGEAVDIPVWSYRTVREAQVTESFESEWTLPPGWGADVNAYWFQSEESQYHGNKSLYRTTGTTAQKLYTPYLNIITGDRLEFFAGTASSTYQKVRVFWSSDKTSWTALGDEMAVVPAAWTQYSVDLSSLAGTQCYLAISAYYAGGGSAAKVYIDHITGPDIIPVIPGIATEPSPGNNDEWISPEYELRWYPGVTGGIPSGYRVYLGTDGGGITRPTSVANGIITVTESWIPPTVLPSNTKYYWQIVPFNNAGEATGNPIWNLTTSPTGGVQVGRGNVDYLDQPVNPYYNYNYTQAIYLQPEINIGGLDLTRIYYQWNGGGGGEVCRDWEIFMGHTTKQPSPPKPTGYL
jgi:hypothetical protein